MPPFNESQFRLDVGARIRDQRKAAQLTLTAASSESGIERERIGRIESGDVEIRMTEFLRLANAFRVRPESLVPSIYSV
ncbi:MAG: Helix-turn-helix domain [Thermoleophilia bacterium]|nr:Helix-turn-helix domain [Thermoleophilia bacterium]